MHDRALKAARDLKGRFSKLLVKVYDAEKKRSEKRSLQLNQPVPGGGHRQGRRAAVYEAGTGQWRAPRSGELHDLIPKGRDCAALRPHALGKPAQHALRSINEPVSP